MASPIRRAAARTGALLIDAEAILDAAIPVVAASPSMEAARARITGVYGADLVAEHPDLWVYLADRCHPNAVGQIFLSRAVADAVERTPVFRSAAMSAPASR